MDRQPQPLRGAKGIPRHTHHPSHHGRLARRHRQHLPACLIPGIKHLRHRRQRGDHQYVAETDAAWADGSYTSNCQTISIEHQGGLDFIPCTQACLDASARLCADIARRYGFGKLERGRNIFLHRDVPPYAHPACPDLCPNGLNWRYIINKANQINGYGDIDMATAAEIWGYNYNKSALGGNMYNAINYELPGRISDVKKAVTALQATVAAQQRQIDKLTTALGSNPEDIADRTAKAVSDKIDKLVITMTAQEKDTAK